jgi:hypothetical protein
MKVKESLTKEQFEQEMAFAPRNYFFPTIESFVANMDKRMATLKHIEGASLRSSLFTVTPDFREDFVSRND